VTTSELLSHPNIPLEVHINNALTILENLRNPNLLSENLEKTLKVALALHDFGKATAYFQKKIRGEKLSPKEKKLSNHSLLSALYTFFVLQKLFKTDYKYPLIGYYIVLNHHSGILKDFSDTLRLGEEKIELLKLQTESINPSAVNRFISNLRLEDELKQLLKFDKGEFLQFLGEVLDIFDELEEDLTSIFNLENLGEFLTVSYLFSLLIDADKTEAGLKEKPLFLGKKVEIPPSAVESYKKTLKGNSPINDLRELAYKIVNTAEIDTEEHFYTLTLPTGMGKTLIGLNFALKLKERLEKKTSKPVKIIYSLPFLSVIDQNAQVLEKVFAPIGDKIVVKHHHLSLGEYLKGENNYELTRLLVESWFAPVVVTTFVQLFESLIPFKNSSARRYNKLTNAVVLIDEVQALPSKFWFLLREYLKEFAKTNNTYFVFTTATQPYLVEEGKELIPQKEKFFSAINRYRVSLKLEKRTLEEFFTEFKPEGGKSYLFILNTVSSSKKAYKLLLECSVPEGDICYLSTHLTPYDRKKRIRELREGKYRFAVTTQLVEAGVDIDFSVVVRDFAPLDSLIQSAGRCNRNFRLPRGEFVVLNLTDENGRRFATRIYDPILLQITEKLLTEFNPTDEVSLIKLSERYYREVWNSKSRDKSEELLKEIKRLNFSKLSAFKLIEEEPYKSDIFVQQNPQAVEIWNAVKQLMKDLKNKKITLWEAKKRFETLKSDFYNFVISVDVSKNTPPIDEDLKIHYIPYEEIDNYYDPKLGYVAEGKTYEEF